MTRSFIHLAVFGTVFLLASLGLPVLATAAPPAGVPAVTGGLTVTATNAATGRPLRQFCVAVAGPSGAHRCTERGTVAFDALPPGEYTADVNAGYDRSRYFDRAAGVVLRAGETERVAAALDPAAVIVTQVRDAVSQVPVAGACVAVAAPGTGGLRVDAFTTCSNAHGRVEIGWLRTGSVQLYIRPGAGPYGAQWLGVHGGTGNQQLARRISVREGQSVTLPPIQLDRAGSITGTARDAVTGRPVAGVCAYGYAVDGSGGPGAGVHCTGANGRYTVGGLGPYAWPVEYTSSDGRYAWQWSGGAPHRFAARRVTVQAGQASRADAALARGARLAGRISDFAGPATGRASVAVFNNVTGDHAAVPVPAYQGGRYEVRGLAGQVVKVQFAPFADGPAHWYGDALDFRSARPVAVRPGVLVGGVDGILPPTVR